MVVDWFDSSEIVLAMSLLQMSWPFGAMIALPIQAYHRAALGWPAVMAVRRGLRSGGAVRVHACSGREQPRSRRRRPRRLPGAVLLPVMIAGRSGAR